jgi:hypothetical protein
MSVQVTVVRECDGCGRSASAQRVEGTAMMSVSLDDFVPEQWTKLAVRFAATPNIEHHGCVCGPCRQALEKALPFLREART